MAETEESGNKYRWLLPRDTKKFHDWLSNLVIGAVHIYKYDLQKDTEKDHHKQAFCLQISLE